MQNRFGIATRPETMSSPDQLIPKFCGIVNFPVKDDPRRTGRIRHWLASADQINDA
jgi:hypothetical protein